MANGITVKQAIETELQGKTNFTTEDTVKCIKHIADGLDNLQCTAVTKKVDALERKVTFHARILSGLWAVTVGSVIAFFSSKFGGK